MIKKLILVFVAFIAINSYAQEGTASPYSFYGIGSLKFKGTVENRSMGGLSIYTDSIHVNLRNPASYASPNLLSFGNETRPVKFTVGGSHSSLNLKTDAESDKANSTTFDYLALSVPVSKKLGVGFGILPYTSVGYKLETLNANEDIEYRFRGEGGLNKAFFSLGYLITEGLSIGVDAQYNFGRIENSILEFVYDDEGNILTLQSRENNRSDLSGLGFNFGLSYKTMFSDKLEFVSALTFAPESDLSSKNERSFSLVTVNNDGQEFEVERANVDLAASGLEETELILPSRFSFGAGIGEPRKWFIGGEYTSLKTGSFNNPFYTSVNSKFEDASTIALGGFFIPKYNSFSSYWKRATYRAGVRFENTGLNVNGESIDEFGISFGVGLPVGLGIGADNLFSNANIGVELGQRGTKNANLIQENFINIHLSLSLNSRWFEKRKYN